MNQCNDRNSQNTNANLRFTNEFNNTDTIKAKDVQNERDHVQQADNANNVNEENKQTEVKSRKRKREQVLDGLKYKKVVIKGTRRNITHYECAYDNCRKVFTKAWNFLDHSRIHLGQRPYECEICGK